MTYEDNITIVGDGGNPDGTGRAKLVLADVPAPDTFEDQQTAAQTFVAALNTANITNVNMGDIGSLQKSESMGAKPGADINVDDRVVVTWRKKSSSRKHRMTIPGAEVSSAAYELIDGGLRLTSTAQTALVAAINARWGMTPPTDSAVILSHTVLRVR